MTDVICGDNLAIMRDMEDESVDLIATDPPFNTGSDRLSDERSYSDKWGSCDDSYAQIPISALKRVIDASRAIHGDAMSNYLSFISVRLIEMHRVLKSKGSIYLHCDYHANSYIRMCMDAIFGNNNLRNEIIWCYTGPGSPGMRQFNRKHDMILWYSKSDEWIFNRDDVRVPHKRLNAHRGGGMMGNNPLNETERMKYLAKGKVPESWWDDFATAGIIASEWVNSPDQKPLALYKRIIKASSNEGDLVLDPFCGSGTTLAAAQSLNRDYMGIDISKKAVKISKNRLNQAVFI